MRVAQQTAFIKMTENIFIQENAFWIVVRETAAIFVGLKVLTKALIQHRFLLCYGMDGVLGSLEEATQYTQSGLFVTGNITSNIIHFVRLFINSDIATKVHKSSHIRVILFFR